jgi:uncharacterized membrane protein YfcA
VPDTAILTFVCVLTYSFEIVFGLAGTILMLTVLSLWFDAKTLVIFSVLPQILVGAIGLARSPRTVNPRFLLGMLSMAGLGAIAGLYLFYQFPPGVFQLLLASAITLFGVSLVTASGKMRLSPLTARVLDFSAGVSQALFGISGPIAMTRLLATFDEKTIVRNYALAFFLALNLLRAAGYLGNNTFTPQIGHMMLVSAPFLAVALWLSNHLHFKVDERVFRTVVAWIILFGGITLFFR